jgi:putative membrane protein
VKRILPILIAAIGIAVMVVLVVHLGADSVLRSLLAIGGLGFAVVCLLHVALIGVMGLAWSALLPGVPLWVGVWGRLMRDSGSEVLPLSQVGGYVLGVRAVALAGVNATRGAASTIVDVTLEFVGQLAYTALGLAWLLHVHSDAISPLPIALGIVVASGMAVGFVIVQRRGIRYVDRIAAILGRGWADRTAAGATALHDALAAIYRHRAGVWNSFLLHFVCWVASAVEIWVALRFADVPLAFGDVMVIEALMYAIRSTFFAVPNAVGVQEGAYLLLGTSFGLPAEMALAISLMKRARDLVIGLPALALWQAIEGGRLARRAGVAKTAATPFTDPD